MARGRRDAKSSVTRKAPAREDVPSVYREMLADAVSSSNTKEGEEERPVKRRRIGGRIVTQGVEEVSAHQSDRSSKCADTSDLDDLFEDVKPNRQQIEQTESEDSADSAVDWEEVGIAEQGGDTPESEVADSGELNLVLEHDSDEHDAPSKAKRRPMTIEDRKLRLDIHKTHLCCLLSHVHLRNHWCNDNNVHTSLRKLLTKKNISYLNPDEGKSQFQRSRSFMDGLSQASDAFKGEFQITARGMSKSRWADSSETLALLQPPDDVDLPMQIADFQEAAQALEASRDVGAQLFCAMLRYAGVDARLVCSLQPLPFQPAPKVELHHVKRRANRSLEERAKAPIRAEGSHIKSSNAESITSEANQNEATRYDRSLSPQATQHTAATATATTTTTPKTTSSLPSRKRRKPVRESKYPVYWAEAFNEAVQKWVPIDPLVTNTIAKPSKFEPSAGEPENHMSYVIAFEDDGSAHDVTKRYVKAYNAKTRRQRVEVTSGGERWWRRVTKRFKRPHGLDRDQVEDAELAAKEAAEPMPRNVQDFKDHPYYALERHLKRHEVMHPKREVGKVGTGRAGNAKSLESIYRRRDVHIVKSADKWYRLGREIKLGEQPLKRVPARRKREASLNIEDQDVADDDNAGTALYAVHQTTVYSPPPVVKGRIPKNVYGNLDVYVPSMVPPGGIHLSHPETARAAKMLGIDYADAVTGFEFKGRHGTAVTKGAVVAIENEEAIGEVIKAFEDDRARSEELKRSLEALRMWKRLLAGLRIMERIEGYDVEGERYERDISMKEGMNKVDEVNDEEEGGGFLPERDVEMEVKPTAGRMPAEGWANVGEDMSGGFIAEDATDNSSIQPDIDDIKSTGHLVDNTESDHGGGFLVDDLDADAEEALLETNANRSETQILAEHTLESRSTSENIPASDCVMSKADEIIKASNVTTANKQAIQPANLSHNDNSQMPDLPHDELEEAMMLQQLHETSGGPVGRSAEMGVRDQPAQPDEAAKLLEAHPPTASASPLGSHEEVKDPFLISDSSGDEKGSLLSHDPDDEDADPEWLD